MGSESMLQEILWDTKIGWWKVDMARRVLLSPKVLIQYMYLIIRIE